MCNGFKEIIIAFQNLDNLYMYKTNVENDCYMFTFYQNIMTTTAVPKDENPIDAYGLRINCLLIKNNTNLT